MNISVTYVHFQYHIFSRNELIILLKAIFRTDIIKNILFKLIVGNENELTVLIANFASFIVKKILINLFADFLLLVLDVRWDVLLFWRMQWADEVHLAIHLGQEEFLVELLFTPLQRYLHVLWHYHMLPVPNECEWSVWDDLIPFFAIVHYVVPSLAFYHEVWFECALLIMVTLEQKEATLNFLKPFIQRLVSRAIVQQLPVGDFENEDVGHRALLIVILVGLLINFILDHYILVFEKVNFFAQLIVAQWVFLRRIFHEIYLNIHQLFWSWQIYEKLLHFYVVMNGKRIVIYRKFLKWCAIRMPVQLEAIIFSIFFIVIGVFIFRQKKVVIESACVQVQEIDGDIIEYLIFLLECLKLLVKFQKFKGVNFEFFPAVISLLV